MTAPDRQYVTEADAIERLRALIRQHGSQTKVAMAYRLHSQQICNALSGRATIPRVLHPVLGLRAVRVYEEVTAP